MNEQQNDHISTIVIKTVASVLVALFIAVGLIFPLVMVVSPSSAHKFYTATGNVQGAYLSARKIFASTEQRYELLIGAEKTKFNRYTRLPMLDRTVKFGLNASAQGKSADGLQQYFELLLQDTDFLPFCAATDNGALKKSSSKALHVYVVGYEGFLKSEYVELLLTKDADAAQIGAFVGFDLFLTRIASIGIFSDGGMSAYLSGVSESAEKEVRDACRQKKALFDSVVRPNGDVAKRVAAVSDGENILKELYLARTLWHLTDNFRAALNETDDLLNAYWRSEFNRLMKIYTTAQ